MLKFFKGKDKGNLIYAPCKGRVVPLAEVPDPVFADNFHFLIFRHVYILTIIFGFVHIFIGIFQKNKL